MPLDPKNDKQLNAAYDLLRGVNKASNMVTEPEKKPVTAPN